MKAKDIRQGEFYHTNLGQGVAIRHHVKTTWKFFIEGRGEMYLAPRDVIETCESFGLPVDITLQLQERARFRAASSGIPFETGIVFLRNETSLRNGSFHRLRKDARFSVYMNGDFMSVATCIPSDCTEVASIETANKYLPECCRI